MPKGRGRKGYVPPRKRMKITVHSRKSFSDSLKEQATNLTDEESNPSDSNADDSTKSWRWSHNTITVAGDEESLDMYHGDIQLKSSTIGAGEYHYNQHSGSIVLTHSSHGTKLTVMGGNQESSLISGLPQMPLHLSIVLLHKLLPLALA